MDLAASYSCLTVSSWTLFGHRRCLDKKGHFALWAGPGSVWSVIAAIGNTTEPHGASDLSHKTYRRYINTAGVEEPNTLAASLLQNRHG